MKTETLSRAVARGIFVAVIALAVPAVGATGPTESRSLESQINKAASVDEAIEIARTSLERQGYEIVLRVDHAAAAASVGLDLRPTQVLFSRQPKYAERLLLKRSATVGIDLPVKVLVFEDQDGGIQLRINPIGYLVDRHDIALTDWVAWSYRRGTEPLADPPEGLITIPSHRGVSDTVHALRAAISANPAFRIPLVLNFSDRPQGPVLAVFGNPNAGTPLMQTTQEAALDLPQKMLVWQHGDKTYITYNDPFFIAARHNITGQDARLGAIANALANFAAAAANP